MSTELNAVKNSVSKLVVQQNTTEHKVEHNAVQNAAIVANKALQELSFPTRKDEEWKYTSFDKVLKNNLSAVSENNLQFDDSYKLEGLDAHYIILKNGVLFDATAIDDIDGITITPINKADSNPNFIKYYNQLHSNDDIFKTLNTSLPANGIFLQVSKGANIEKAVVIVNIIDASSNAVLVQPRHLIVVDENAQFKLMEYQRTKGNNDGLTNQMIEIQVSASAYMQHIVLQDDLNSASALHNTFVNQEANSTYSNYVYSLKAGIIRNNVNLSLNGEHCEGNLYGLYLLEGKEHVDNHTVVDHKVPNCQSNEYYKGVLKDHSTAVFNGKVFVRQDAQKTNAYQQNRNILLSDDATINTKPQLEIWADDVKCSHGATVGQLDEDQLFYLKARGIDHEKAKSLMVYAFASEVVEQVKNQAIRNYLFGAISKKLNFQID